MDKTVGTVEQLERFITHAKLYPRNCIRVSGGEGGGDMDL